MVTNTSDIAVKPAKRREDFWDVIRGILILCVFAGHAIGGWNYITFDFLVQPGSFLFDQWIVSRCFINCSVPLFIFISGYMVNEKYYSTLGKFYIKRIPRFAVPYIFWTIVYVLVEIIIYKTDVTLEGTFCGWYGIQLYYLLVMVQLVILTPIFFKVKNKKAVLIASCVINVVNNAIHVVYHYTEGTIVPNELMLCTCYIFFYTFGMYLRNTDPDALKKISLKVSIILFAIGAAIYIAASFAVVHFTNSALAGVSFITIASFICSVGSIILVFKLRERSTGYVAKNPVAKMLRWFGEYSMDFFVVHWIFENYIKVWFLNNVSTDYMILSNLIIVVATTALCVVYTLIAKTFRKYVINPINMKFKK